MMGSVWIVVTASVLLGLATGMIFRMWMMGPVSLIVAIGSAIVLQLDGFGFVTGILTVTACLFISQAAYLLGATLMSRHAMSKFLADDSIDRDPDDRR